MTHKNGFHPLISTWFRAAFPEPTPPQEQGWPSIAAGKHTLILAPTGSGKTLAAFLWSIDELYRQAAEHGAERFVKNATGVHTLYISPLKALNNDIERNLRQPLAGIKKLAGEHDEAPPEIRVAVRTGDTPAHVRQSMLRKPPHILITTPESLYLLLTSPRGRELFRNLRYLIVDEIHALCNNKRGVHLSLSIERLMALCTDEPVRIGLSATQRPLERIAAYLGGQRWQAGHKRYIPRPVNIIDCGRRKEMHVQVIAPVEDFGDLPESSVWPAVIDKVYALIRAHRTTLIFVNMRAQAERIARQLNEKHREMTGDPEAELALAHHGSISREARAAVEARLKAGKIPAVIATASLELGIDIGAIDLVVQLESPRQVTSALQRIGRSGHAVNAASKGIIIPLYPADMDDAVAITQCMFTGDIEETHIPENCLDVLAQHIVAEVAMREWPREDLLRLFRQSYCYRTLSPAAFNSVLDMLAGRYAGGALRALQPRLSWDHINDRLIARRGSRLVAVLNAGTIPDRGYYGVYLAGSNTRLGEMEEEFVFESLPGDVFFLGANEWRIQEITRDRIIVAPVRAVKPRAPFWKGDRLMRDFATAQKIGAFRRELAAHLNENDAANRLAQRLQIDPPLAENLCDYFRRQTAHTGALPTDVEFIAESFHDHAGEPLFVLHAPVGARVAGAWAIVLAARLEQQLGVQIQYDYDDDGFIFRLIDHPGGIDMARLLMPAPEEAMQWLAQRLMDTPAFLVHFRYNAGRALLLPRSTSRKRIPLWLQRLRAADLLQIVRRHDDFPLLVETLRDCLHDLFDVDNLARVLQRLRAGEIRVRPVATPSPSPMASGLMYRFLSTHLYEMDQPRRPGDVAASHGTLSAELLTQDTHELRGILTPELVQEAEARWQHLAPAFRAAGPEGLFEVIEKLGPISVDELQKRARGEVGPWLQSLQEAGRIVCLHGTFSGWITTETAQEYGQPADAAGQKQRLLRYLQSHGPQAIERIARATSVPLEQVASLLAELRDAKQVVCGRLLQDSNEITWCERQNFAQLYRMAIGRRRSAVTPQPREMFYPFTLAWHDIGRAGRAQQKILRRYTGCVLPRHFLEREILSTRCGPDAGVFDVFARNVASGDIILRSAAGTGGWCFTARAQGHIFGSRKTLAERAEHLPEPAQTVYRFLQDNGASPERDMAQGTGLSALQIQGGLRTLVQHDLVSCDDYTAFRDLPERTTSTEERPVATGSISPAVLPWQGRRPETSGRRQLIRRRVHQQVLAQNRPGRWFLTIAFAAHGKDADPTTRAKKQARLLLQRYGILVKDWYRREKGLLPWYPIFQALKRLEWQGEIRRGYFIEGLSGIQFALPEAVELLQQLQNDARTVPHIPVLLSTADPALPLGGNVPWDLRDINGKPLSITRGPQNHLLFLNGRPVLYSENYGQRLWQLSDSDALTAKDIFTAMQRWLLLPVAVRPRKRIEIHAIDDRPVLENPLAAGLVECGFEKEGEKLVMWVSGVGG